MINPILERELKTRMRTWRTPIILMIYLILLGLVIGIFFFGSSMDGTFNPRIAVEAYQVIVIAQFVLLMFIIPALTAIAISGERERQTLDLMLCTDISPWKIIFGKISSALSFVFLIILIAMPFMGIVFLFGGISLWEIAKIILYYMLTAFMISSIGIYCSIRFKKNITAIIMTYLIVGLLIVGTLIVFGVVVMIIQNVYHYSYFDQHAYQLMLGILTPNPGFGMLSVLYGKSGFFTDIFNMSNLSGLLNYIEPWMTCSVFNILLTVAFLFLSKLRLSKVR